MPTDNSYVFSEMLLISTTLEILKADSLLERLNELVKQLSWFVEKTLILAAHFATDFKERSSFFADRTNLLSGT
jgi:hypothetical protein